MGLDMYLSRKTYVKNWDHMKPKERHVITIVHGDGSPVTGIDVSKISYIEEQVGYWRKANHIHKWFVDNVQDGDDDCGNYYVDRDKLQELLELCKQVASKRLVASSVLPTKAGFFFGGTEYDEYYFQDVEETIAILEPLIADPENCGDYYYHSSW